MTLRAVGDLLDHGVVFVLRGGSADEVVRAGLELVGYGATALEVTWTVPDAASVLRTLKQRTESVVVGMGTVVRPDDADAAVDAGADFLVTPGFHRPTVRRALERSPVVLPGVTTPGEVMQALDAGASALKLFPATLGPSYLAALTGPFPDVPFVPSGGVRSADAVAWLDAGAAALSVGSSIAALTPAAAARAVGTLLEQVVDHRACDH